MQFLIYCYWWAYRFKAFAATHPLSELTTPEEAAAAVPAPSESGDQANMGEGHADAAEQSSKPVSAGLTEAEELEKYIAIREEMYKKAKEFDSKISDFENAIRRPYFHVRPINVAELENWHNYLDFIEREDDLNKVLGFVYCPSLALFFSFVVYSCPCYTLTHS